MAGKSEKTLKNLVKEDAAKKKEVLPIPCDELSERIQKELEMPKNLHSVIVKHLWADRYRVNVFVTEKDNTIFGSKVCIRKSYFIRFINNSLHIYPDDKFSPKLLKRPDTPIEKIYKNSASTAV